MAPLIFLVVALLIRPCRNRASIALRVMPGNTLVFTTVSHRAWKTEYG